MKLFLSILTLFLAFIGFAQEKFEREYRIEYTDVPENAKQLISEQFKVKKVKWYTEESQDGRTIEAKLCHHKHKYSIEFNTDGNLIDIEKQVKHKTLSAQTQQLLDKALKNTFNNYRIKKIQLQFLTALKTYDVSKVSNFEIVVKAKKNNHWDLYEVLINPKGEVLKNLKFANPNTDNLQF